jgi:CDP-diacylglycerol--glycerol-3-phosphate 3-phosphatidyltransferase
VEIPESLRRRRPTLTEIARARFQDLFNPAGAFLTRLGLHPNTITLAGFAGTAIGATFLASGNLVVGGAVVLVMGLIDALDGAMARQLGRRSAFGAFVDSVTDRYSELVVYAGLMAHYLSREDVSMAGVVFAAAAGAVLVSYVKARAEGLGFEAGIGLLTRMERLLLLGPSLILGFPALGLGAIAVFAHVTALQRILYVRRQARQTDEGRR